MTKKLKDLMNMDNIADSLDDKELVKIGQQILAGFDEDEGSVKDWLLDVEKVLELASLKADKKSQPLPQSANIKFPLITKAAYEFSSRVYPEIIKDGQVVQTRVIGLDLTGEKKRQAKRVQDYMNYQLMFKDSCFEQDLDKMLVMLALIGFVCKKTYYDPVREEVKSEICNYKDLIINAKVKNLDDAPRISHVLHISLNEAIEHVRSGLYLEEPIKDLINRHSADNIRPVIDVIEQHCFLDLDEDDYEEPYIVTVLKDSGKVLRIVARFTKDDIKEKNNKVRYINPIQHFTDFHFLVSPKGHFQGVGFGILMLHLTETINTMLNQITDAGTLANLQAGYIDSRAKMVETGNSLHDPGELKKIKTASGMTVKDSVHLINFKEPSTVLFQTLGLLIETTRDLSSATDVMTGGADTQNAKTGAVLALQEAGRRVITSIQKRVYRSITAELRKVFRHNQMYLDPNVYVEVLDDDLAVSNKDFDAKTINVVPVADPTLSSESARVAQAQFLAGTMQFPGVKPLAVTKRIYESTNIPNIDELLMSEEELQQQQQAPNPEVIQVQAEIEGRAQELNIKGRELELREKELMIAAAKTEMELIKMKSEIILNLAKAEAQEAGTQLKDYNQQFNMIQSTIQNIMHDRQMQQDLRMHEDEMMMKQQEAQNANQDTGMDQSGSYPGSDESNF